MDDSQSEVGYGEAQDAHRRNSPRRKIILGLTLVGVAVGSLALAPAPPALVWNFTPSVPTGLYRVEHGVPAIGDLLVITPAGAAENAVRHYGVLHPGRVLIKPLAAVAGDEVCRIGSNVSVNDRPVAIARALTSRGDLLPSWDGCRQLAASEIFLIAPHTDSFDSRYFGSTTSDYVIGIARPVLTFLSEEAG